MNETTAYVPGLSPVENKELSARFDGGRLSSDGGVLMLRGIADGAVSPVLPVPGRFGAGCEAKFLGAVSTSATERSTLLSIIFCPVVTLRIAFQWRPQCARSRRASTSAAKAAPPSSKDLNPALFVDRRAVVGRRLAGVESDRHFERDRAVDPLARAGLVKLASVKAT